ncbi:MAG TPA: M20/M25/M40 family metallo-hydrolase [Pyrinomonadaceae bacterium]|nr:M20/M25/M40 family metallo-hydrolase [Pyrinomonadaceae bacterium]
MRRKIFQLLLVAVLATGAFAQRGGAVGASDVSVERLRAHVAYLASDKLEGRRTGTPGAIAAAQYIAQEFARYGLGGGVHWPAGTKERMNAYMQKFPYVSGVELGKANAMTFTPRAGEASPAARAQGETATGAQGETPAGTTAAASLDLRIGEDWMPLTWSASARVESAPVTYVGYGITAAEAGHDDYAGVDVRGRIALAFAGTPDGDNPHGSFARFADLRFKAAAARDHGARALVLIAREENFKDDKLARLRLEESAASGDAGIPVVVISRQAARRALEAAATPALTFAELEKAMSPANADAAAGRSNVAGAATGNVSGNVVGAGAAAGNVTGTAAGNVAGAGASPSRQGAGGAARRSFSAPLQNIAFSVNTEIVRQEAPATNVVGILEGSDAKLKHEVVVIGAHYDHLGRGGQGSLAAREGEIHHGADDNASGVAGLLELARTFARERKSVRRTLVFAAFGGEEEGLLGSSYYVRNPSRPLAQTVAMINLDMIGRMKENKLMVGGVGTAREWKEWLAKADSALHLNVKAAGTTSPEEEVERGNYPVVIGANGGVIANAVTGGGFALTLTEDGFGPSDHASFYARQTPVLFFWTGTHEDYHKPSDTADRLNYEGQLRIVSFVARIVRALDASDARPTYTLAKTDAVAGRSTGFRVYLGTIPNYAEGGDGLKLDSVREDSPAAKAGLRAGDVIVRLAGRDVRNVYDYTYALGEMSGGVEYEVEVMRGGERLKLKLTPAARK